uniref:Uncharacterized protein n=1 Tax=Strigamia maritima TaxID=126957 RepID=T1IK10_STRMM
MPDFPHQASSEGFSSQLENFSLSPTQAIANNQPLEVVVHGNAEEYLDLRDTFLLLNVKVTKRDGTELIMPVAAKPNAQPPVVAVDGHKVAPANLEDAKDSYQTAALYYKDHGGTFEVNNPIDVKARSEYGLVKRFGRLMGSGDRGCLQMFSKLHADLFNQSHLLINGVTIKLLLTRSKDSFSLISSEDDADYVTSVTQATLYVKKRASRTHASNRSKNAVYPIRRTEVKTFTIPTGYRNANIDQAYIGQFPSRLILGLVSNESYNGSYKKNPLISNITTYLTYPFNSMVKVIQPLL